MSSDRQNPEVRRIAGELQASIRKARISASGKLPQPDGPIEHDLAVMRANCDIATAPFTSHRPVLGRFIILAKNIARELLVQLLERQSVYNDAAARAIAHLKDRLDALAREQARIAQRVAALESMAGLGQPQSALPQALSPDSAQRLDGIELRRLNDRLDALEKIVGGGDSAADKRP